MSEFTDLLHRQQKKLNAWQKARPIQGYDQNVWRMDTYGAVIKWEEYGQTTKYGWEIDHELPETHFPGVVNSAGNLRALHWQNNRKKSDKIDLRSFLGGV